MKSLLIIGAGQYGHLIKELAESLGYDKVDFLDDNNEEAIGKIAELENLQGNYTEAICSIGNVELRKEFLSRIKNKATLINKSAYISPSAKIAKGCVIEANTVVSTDVVIEEGCFICAGAVINHNSVVKKYCQIDCNAVVKGTVSEGTKVNCCEVWKG